MPKYPKAGAHGKAARSAAVAAIRESVARLPRINRSDLHARRPRGEAYSKTSTGPFIEIAVDHFCRIPSRGQLAAHRLRQHNRTMPPTGTAKRDREVTLTLPDIMGNEIGQQALDAAEKFAGLGK